MTTSPPARAAMFSKEEIKEICALTPMQRGMLHHALLQPQSRAYHEQLILRLDGEVDAARMEAAWQHVVNANDALRGRFLSARVSNPVHMIPFAEPVKMVLHRIANPTQIAGEKGLPAEVEACLADDLAQGFDLASAHPMRLSLLTADGTSWLVWSFHHILLDGWSIGLVLEQVLAHYAGTPQAAADYLPYLRWLAGRDNAASLEYWKTAFADFSGEGLVTQQGTSHARATASIDAPTSARLQALAQAHRASLHHLLLTAWALTASRFLDQRDVIVPTVLAGRPADVEGAYKLVGLLINTVPMRVTVQDGDSFTSVLRRVRDDSLQASRYQHVSMADIQSVTGKLPIDHVLLVQGMPHQQILDARFGDATVGQAEFRESVPYALEVSLTPHDAGIGIALSGNSDAGWMQSLARGLQRLLCEVAEKPAHRLGDLDMLDAAERDSVLAWGNGGPAPEPCTILQAIDAQIARTPDAPALACGNVRLSYRELDHRANRLAHLLLSAGPLAPDTPVALVARRNADLPAGLLAVLRAGAAYVPVDPDFPPDRLRLMLEASRCRLAFVSPDLVTQLPALSGIRVLPLNADAADARQMPIVPPSRAPSPDDLAYVIFTSGSTGTPKGTMLRHRNVASFFAGLPEAFGFGPGDRILGVTTISFDIAALELLGALTCGMTIVLASEEQARDPVQLLDLVEREKVDVLQMTPTRLKLLLDAAGPQAALPGVRTLLVGGEALSQTLAAQLLSLSELRVFNVYGPTETTIWSTSWQLAPGPVRLGRVLPGEQLLVLSTQRCLQPPCAIGEIALAGDGVGRGYLNDPDRTAQRFVNVPDVAGLVYLTGDLGRWNADGSLDYLGRRDEQVKVRGMRIEIGEIEHHLRQLPEVRDAVAAVRKNAAGEAELVAYLVGPRHDPVNATYHACLSAHLPAAMIPSHFVLLDSLPQTPNGKTDRRALPDPRADMTAATIRTPAPGLEQTFTRLFSEVLGRTIGPDDDFFLAGGHSLKAIQAIGRINRELGAGYTLRDLYRTPSAAALAASGVSRVPSISRAAEAPDYPLSYAQQALWILDQMQPGYAGYNVPGAYMLQGELNIPALEQAWQALAARHESLRTVFRTINGQPRQVILDSMTIPVEQLLPGERTLPELIAEVTCRSFNLSTGPLVRIVLIPVDAVRQAMVLVTHHIIGDGWSDTVLARDLAVAYRNVLNGKATDEALPAPSPVRYRDFAVWQQAYLASSLAKAHRDFWQHRLVDLPRLTLPADGPRSKALSRRGARVELRMSPAESASWMTAVPTARRYATLAAATLALLHLESRQSDIVLGLPVANRDRAELQEQVGLHINMLPLRTPLRPDAPLQQLREECAAGIVEAMAHADYPFARLVDELGLTAESGRHPVFDAMLIYHQHPTPVLQFDGVVTEVHDPQSYTSRFDLDFEVWTTAEGMHGFIEYDASLFSAERARGFADKWRALLMELATRPHATLRDTCQRIAPRKDDTAAFVMKSMALDEEF